MDSELYFRRRASPYPLFVLFLNYLEHVCLNGYRASGFRKRYGVLNAFRVCADLCVNAGTDF